jgi:6-pyruvoyltetrahydropterin/6-carboxytetrahydropterin synthase
MSEVTVAVRHTFETGHRLPHLAGKCQSLHGHSWSVEVEFTAGHVPGPSGVIAEFGALKSDLRRWIDDNLDHGLMLGIDDDLVSLADHGKVYLFGRHHNTEGLKWPTVENVAILLARVGREIGLRRTVTVRSVTVQETPTNVARWYA